MNLINEDDQTYKLTEENKNIPVLFVNLPLGTDLQKQPLIRVDGKDLGNLFYNTCNNIDGCRTNVAINENIIDLFKKGKNMTVVVNIFGSSKNFEINFPLKNFSKSYTKLLKK
jgi:invasion protein IalB